MRPRVGWMTPNDIAILEWLDHYRIPAPARQLYITMESAPSYNTVWRRMKRLEEMDLIDAHPDADGYYEINERGERYLNDPDATAEEFMPDNDDEDDQDDGDDESEADEE